MLVKVLFVSASDRIGGAAIGAYRLLKALQAEGLQSEMLVWRKVTADPSVHRLATHLNRLARARRKLGAIRHARRLRDNPRRAESGYWSLNLYGYPIAAAINSFGADIVHLNWVGDNFLPIEEVAKINAPIVWTLHDMWAFTGGCHTAYECQNYRTGCGNCSQLVGSAPQDISARVNRKKQRAWANVPMTVVCPSRWLADCARSSAVLKEKSIEVIGYTFDPGIFKPIDPIVARRAFNLPADKQLVLFGAIGGTSDPHKGFRFLRQALSGLAEDSNIEVVTFGGEQAVDLGLSLQCHQIGLLRDEVSIGLLYSACDLYVLPSLQENLPNTVIEALACGTPCVTFAGSGTNDLVQHEKNGYLARMRDSDDLLTGIQWALERSWPRQGLHEWIVERHNSKAICEQYRQLYQSLLAQTRSQSAR